MARTGSGSQVAPANLPVGHERPRVSLVPGPVREVVRFVQRKPLGALGGLIVLLLLLVALGAESLAPYSYDRISIRDRLDDPSPAYPFGTDEQGRDVYSRVIYGARTTVLVGLGATLVSVLIASTLGIVSGYYGGWFDILIQRVVDIWLAFPGLIFVLFVVSIFPRGTLTLVITIGVLFAAASSRVVRSATIALRESLFIESARATGVSDARILLRHIFPNVVPIVIITASIQIGGVILLEASLSFLGFGPPPPFPSWGRMLQEARSQMEYHPNLALFPGLAIALVVYAFNMLGDGLRDVLDPRLRGSR